MWTNVKRIQNFISRFVKTEISTNAFPTFKQYTHSNLYFLFKFPQRKKIPYLTIAILREIGENPIATWEI